MKKLFIVSVLFFVPFISFASFDRDLQYGSKGDTIIELQEFLTDQGLYSGPVTGNFYALTLAAVKKFQAEEGIAPVSGYFGPITRGVANQILTVSDNEEDATVSDTPVDLSKKAAPEETMKITLPSGQIVEIDKNGNIVSDIIPPPTVIITNTTPSPFPQESLGGVVTSKNMDTELEPSYTEQELIDVLRLAIVSWQHGKPIAGNGNQTLPSWVTNETASSAQIGINASAIKVTNDITASIVFEDKAVAQVHMSNMNIVPGEIAGSAELTDLIPSTAYTYSFVWHEKGRADTIITKTFKTLAQ